MEIGHRSLALNGRLTSVSTTLAPDVLSETGHSFSLLDRTNPTELQGSVATRWSCPNHDKHSTRPHSGSLYGFMPQRNFDNVSCFRPYPKPITLSR